MQDLTIRLEHRAGALADLGEALGRAGISVEGGGLFADGATVIAHYLVHDGGAAAAVLRAAGIRVEAVREVTIVRLQQAIPGQLGLIARRMADAGVGIDAQYSDHDNRLILVVNDPIRAQQVADTWTEIHARRR
jgi:hypothetical protein